MVPSGRAFRQVLLFGIKGVQRNLEGNAADLFRFAGFGKLSGCNGFRATGTPNLYSALRRANFRVAVRPSKLACTRREESGIAVSSTAIFISAAPLESVTA